MSGIDDYKITNTSGYKIQDIPGDSMSGTSAQNKEAFDKLGLLIISQYNDMIDYVKTNVIQRQVTLDKIYPIGSIYMSVNSTNPTSLFGGTWIRLKDTFLLASGDTYSADSNTYTTAQHGSADATLVSHSHMVSGSTSDATAHSHTVSGSTASGGTHRHGIESGGYSTSSTAVTTTAFYRGNKALSNNIHYSEYNNGHTHTFSVKSGSAGAHSHTVSGKAATTGSSATGANMPPYLAVYVWKRTE